MARKKAGDYDQSLLDLYDRYAHDLISRREFLDTARKFAMAGFTATAILESLSPKYAEAKQLATDDKRLSNQYIEYLSANGSGIMRAYLSRPAGTRDKLPGILVIHENRGLNPHIEDVARRVGLAGFLALAPDALTPLGGYPGTDEEGKALQRQLDRGQMTEDFIAAARYLQSHPECNGKIGVVGFCFGGSMANTLAVKLPNLIAAVPFYGGQPDAAEVANIRASLLLHFAELDQRINKGWPNYEAALKKAGTDYTSYMYKSVNHAFHNDTTPRYDEAAARLAWRRSIDFFNDKLR